MKASLYIFLVALIVSFIDANCPPNDFDAIKLNIDLFIRPKRWYSVKQLPVTYQPRNQFFCVYAEYTPWTGFCPFCGDRPRIKVFNRALRDSVSGNERSVNFRALIPQPAKSPGKAYVGPRFFPFGLINNKSNYWVVAAGTYSNVLKGINNSTVDNYEWAIITTGEPTTGGNNGKCYSDGGMWIFSRQAIPPDGVIQAVEVVASSLGLDTSVWQLVKHNGCKY